MTTFENIFFERNFDHILVKLFLYLKCDEESIGNFGNISDKMVEKIKTNSILRKIICGIFDSKS